MAEALQRLSAQFAGLSLDKVGSWPLTPKLAVWIGAFVLCAAAGGFGVWSGQVDRLRQLETEENTLRDQFRQKLQQVVNLEELRRQKEQINQHVLTLERQLPSRSEMEELLSELSRAWTGRGVEFESLKPAPRITRDYYEELPIALRVTGRFHDLGAFTSDLANLPRIVTLQNLALQTGKDGALTMDATVRSFRYLNEDELRAQRQAGQAKKK